MQTELIFITEHGLLSHNVGITIASIDEAGEIDRFACFILDVGRCTLSYGVNKEPRVTLCEAHLVEIWTGLGHKVFHRPNSFKESTWPLT